jgi:hypothetical protein
MSDDLVAFIGARLDEDEAAANAATIGPWAVGREDGDGGWHILRGIGIVAGPGHEGGGVWGRPDADHIARYDPARALREVAAKRRVLERHRPVGGTPSYRAQACAGCGTEGYCDDPVTEKMSDCPELRDMAAIWDAHPDYRQAWKPWT